MPESKDLVKPVTMRPRLATVSSDTDGDEVTDGRSSDLGSDLGHTWEVGPSSEETSTTNPGPRAATSPAQPRMTQADRPLTTNTNTRPHGLAGDKASVSTNTVSGAEPLTINSSMLTRDKFLTSTTIHPSLSTVAVLAVRGAPAQPQPGLQPAQQPGVAAGQHRGPLLRRRAAQPRHLGPRQHAAARPRPRHPARGLRLARH